MEYLKKFNQDLRNYKIQVRHNYVNKMNKQTIALNHFISDEKDVITDLIENNKQVSAACLPIAKQIVIFDKKMCFLLPKIGDLFIGIAHNNVIEKVTFIVSNYLDEFFIEGKLIKINDLLLWQFTELPVILLTITDYANIHLMVQISINNNYNLQNSNQDVFKAYYGYFNQKIKQELMNNGVYQIPLLNQVNCLKIVCGIWYVDQI